MKKIKRFTLLCFDRFQYLVGIDEPLTPKEFFFTALVGIAFVFLFFVYLFCFY